MGHMTKLTPRMARFAAEYMIDLNAKQAAIRAGYVARNADTAGWDLLQHPAVQADIARRSQRLYDRFALSPERGLHELARIAFADIRGLYNDDGTVRDLKDIDDDTLAAVASIVIAEGRTGRIVKVRPLDRLVALTLLARHFGLFNDRLEIGVSDGLAEAMAAGRARAP